MRLGWRGLCLIIGILVLATIGLDAQFRFPYRLRIEPPAPPAGSGAAQWFVATTGNDANLCTTSASPCLTMSGVHGKTIQAGDIVEFAAGTYAGMTWTKSGTSGSSITVRGSSGTCPTTVNSDAFSRGFRPDPAVTLTGGVVVNASDVTFSCFKMTDGQGFDVPDNSRRRLAFYDNYLDGTSAGDGFLISNNQATLASQLPDTVTISRNFVTEYSTCIHAIANNLTVTDNECLRMTGGETDHVHPYGDTHLYRNNYFHGNVHTDAPGAHADCFQVFNLGGANEALRYSRNITIDRNTCMHFNEMIITSNSTANATLMDNWTVTNNIFAYPRLSGGGVGGGGFGQTTDVLFYHNTSFQASWGCGRGEALTQATVTVKNNILDGTFGAQADCTLTISFNTQASGAQFVSTVTPDFHLQATSPAINAGTTGLGVTTDRDDVTRDAQPDQGAYEFQ